MPITKLDDGTRLHCLLRSEARVLAQHVHGYFNHGITLSSHATVFDVGANVGVFSLSVRRRSPTAKVYAWEPVPPIYEVLARNAASFGEGRLIALPYGAGEAPAEFEIVYFPRSPALSTCHPELWEEDPESFVRAVRGSLHEARQAVWFGRLLPSCLARPLAWYLRARTEKYRCEVRPISQVIQEYEIGVVDLLKLDCEGAELDALAGIAGDHWSRIQQVVVEVHDVDRRLEKVCKLLSAHGLSQLSIEHEKGFEDTPLHNVFAHR